MADDLPNPPRRWAITPHTEALCQPLEPGDECTIVNESGERRWIACVGGSSSTILWLQTELARASEDAAEARRSLEEVEELYRRAVDQALQAHTELAQARESFRVLADRIRKHAPTLREYLVSHGTPPREVVDAWNEAVYSVAIHCQLMARAGQDDDDRPQRGIVPTSVPKEPLSTIPVTIRTAELPEWAPKTTGDTGPASERQEGDG